MPILDVEIVGELARQTPGLASELAEASARALRTRPGGLWVRLRYLPADCYAENAGGPTDVAPVFVSVIASKAPKSRQERQIEAQALTTAIADALNRPADNVHIIYEPPAAGRVSFGGQLVP